MKVLRLIWRILVVLCQEIFKLGQKYRAYRTLKAQQKLEQLDPENPTEDPTTSAQTISNPPEVPSTIEETPPSEPIVTQIVSDPEATPCPPELAVAEAPIVTQPTIPLVDVEALSSPSSQLVDMQWTPPGTGAQVQNILIADGFIYIGQQELDAPERCPFLIDSSLKLHTPKPQRRQELLGMDWSQAGQVSYATLTPEMRSVFLGWLATGRKDRDLPLSALRLFLYGVEHRVVSLLSGDRTVDELLALILELERLEVQYAHHTAIIPQIQQLTECCQIQLALSCQPETLLALLPVEHKLSMALKVVIGRCIEQSKAIPMMLLWAWYLSSAVAVDLKTPAKRCESAFNFLIQTRGEQREFAIEAGENPPMLPVVYCPFGPSSDPEPILILHTIDIAGLESQLTMLEPLIEDCTNDLDAYSRLIGRSPELDGTPAAVALLPQELVFLTGNEQVSAIRAWFQGLFSEQDLVVRSGNDLLAQWPTATTGKIRKKEAELLGLFLAKFGFGYVPDVRYWQPTFNPKHPVILFRLEQLGVEPPSADYPAALMTLELFPFFEIESGADIDSLFDEQLDITPSERSRLMAVQHWRIERPLTWKQACKRVKKLSQEEQFKLAVTLNLQLEQDWQLEDDRYRDLQALIPLPEREFAVEEAIAESPEVEVGEPLHVEAEPESASEAEVPSDDEIDDREDSQVSDEPEEPSTPTFTLNTQLIAQRSQESQVASGLLSEIFEEEDPAPVQAQPIPESAIETADSVTASENVNTNELSLGLDEFHWHLLRRIGQQDSWDRAELEAIAQDQGLLLDGALENINDVAFDQCDEALTEGDDPIEVNDWVYEELQAA